MRLNLGCGTNRLLGWDNYDAEIDIEKPLPFADGSADFILAEHVVEHVGYYQAIEFFKECHRVLRTDGILRIAVPSLVQIYQLSGEDYFRFVSKWAEGEASKRGAMRAILYAHGHKTAWSGELLQATIYFAGFDETVLCFPGISDHAELRGVEGHGKVIGARFNNIETVVCEGTKQ